jgi:uncharacterized protein (TIGR03435 family)
MNGIDVAGWTLLHFLWQGALAAAVAAAGLRLLRTPQARYALACSALLVMLAAPVLTAWWLSPDGPRTSAAVAGWTSATVPAGAVIPALAERPYESSALPASPQPEPKLPPIDLTSVMPLVVAIWLSGVSLLLARLAGGCWRIRRLHRDAFFEPVSQWQVAADAIARRLRLPRPVFIVDSARVDTPTVIGWIRPVILLPVAAMANLAPAQVEAILAHELAHIRRHDFLVNVLQTIAETFLFYHPAVWWLSSRIRTEREHCCDDVAVDVCGDPISYAAALTELAAWSLGRPRLMVAATGGSLLARVRRLLHVTSESGTRSSSGMLIGGLALGLVIAAGSARAISIAPVEEPAGTAADNRGFGPPDINRFLGFELFPGPKIWATDDPRDGSAWRVTIKYASGDMPMIGFTARSIIRQAYGLVDTPIANAPAWLDRESLDVEISSQLSAAPGVSDPDALQAALRALVDERLGLVAHMEQREFPVYALVRTSDRALGPNIRPTTKACWNAETLAAAKASGKLAREIAQRFCGVEDTFTGFSAANATMAQFVARISRPPHILSADRPIVDRTGLTAAYDFELRFGPLPLAAIGAGHPWVGAMLSPFGVRSLATALPEQLGLELKESTAAFDVLVIDHIEKPATSLRDSLPR